MEKNNTFRYFIICLFWVMNIFSAAHAHKGSEYFLDVYKTRQITEEQIYSKFKNEFNELAKIHPESIYEIDSNKFYTLKRKILDGVAKMGDFSYINLAAVWYPDKSVYYSIDLVDKNDNRLINFYSKPDDSFADPDHLIKTWLEYQDIVFKKKLFADKSCPAFHCLNNFQHPLVRKYLKIFNEKVPKNESRLVQILRNDSNDERRAAAAFLLAHTKDGRKLIDTLTPAMRDPSSSVRNNAMRVLAETIRTLKNADFPIEKAIAALDYPGVMDRNKAMYIIMTLSEQPRYKEYLIRHAHKELIEQLKFNAPNIHRLAYITLKIISGQNYPERDYQAWENWLEKQNNGQS